MIAFVLLLWMQVLALESANQEARNRAKNSQSKVLLADHFSTAQANFTITDAELNKAFITILNPQELSSELPPATHITLTLSTSTYNQTCVFSSPSSLCLIKNLTTLPLSLHFSNPNPNASLPIHFVSYQSKLTATRANTKQVFDSLYEINVEKNRGIVMLRCNDPDIQDYDVKMYATVTFQKVRFSNIIYFLFESSRNGYFFVDAKDAMQWCTQMLTYMSLHELHHRKWKDFIVKDRPNEYTIKGQPQQDMRLDLSIVGTGQSIILNSTLTVQLLGTDPSSPSNPPVSLQTYQVTNPQSKPTMILNLIFSKSQFLNHRNLTVKLSTSNQTMIINGQFEITDLHFIDAEQVSYFDLRKGETLNYTLAVNSPRIETSVEVVGGERKVEVQKRGCDRKNNEGEEGKGKGCRIQLRAREDVKGFRMVMEQLKNHKYQLKQSQSITQRIRQTQTLYFLHTSKTQFQLTTNSQNVILFVSSPTCVLPSQSCHQYSGNWRQPIIISPSQLTSYTIAVQALDDTVFTLRVDDTNEQYFRLKDGEPFSYTLKAGDEEIGFLFEAPKGLAVGINLVAPLNTAFMYVSNNRTMPVGSDEDLRSTDGRLYFPKRELNSTDFSILLKRSSPNSMYKLSFTIIASTTESIQPLQPSTSHYQTLHSDHPKIFLLNYKRSQSNILSFYSPHTSDLEVEIKVAETVTGFDNSEALVIKAQKELLELEGYAAEYCSMDEKQLCEMYLRVENRGKVEVDMVLAQIVQQAILELKDGGWQAFPLTVMTAELKFYFVPKHPKNSINIMFNATDPSLTILYRLWKTDFKYNLSKWPFPNPTNISSSSPPSSTNPLPTLKHISISPQSLTSCWPECLLLISIIGADQNLIRNAIEWESNSVRDSYSLMASNDVIELIENQRIDLMMRKGEQKLVTVNLKHFLEKEVLTFFTGSTVGAMRVVAKVATNGKVRVPTEKKYDFQFGVAETQLPLAKIKQKLTQLKMQDDKQKYLRLLLLTQHQTKLSLQFSSRNSLIHQLHFNTLHPISLASNSHRVYQLYPTQPYRLKLLPHKGHPWISYKSCNLTQLHECIEGMREPTELVTKYEEVVGRREDGKVMVLRVEAKGDAVEMDVYVVTQFGELEVREGMAMTDFCGKGKVNRYVMTVGRGQETVVKVQVMDGNPEVKVWRNLLLPIHKRKNQHGLIQIALSPAAASTPDHHYDSLSLNVEMQTIRLTIESQSENSYFTIGYTTGDKGVKLQDGMLMSALVEPGKNVSFFYQNSRKRKEELMAMISFETSSQMADADIKLYYYSQNNSIDNATPNKPPSHLPQPHPTLLLLLPSNYSQYQLLLSNPSPTSPLSLTCVINQAQLLILPYNLQFPFLLKPNFKHTLLVEVSNPGTLAIHLRKCTQGTLIFAYSYDYEAVKREEYFAEFEVEESLKEVVVRGKVGTLYVVVWGSAEVGVAVMVRYYRAKEAMPRHNVRYDAGIQYQLMSSVESEVKFMPLACDGGNCGEVKYEYMGSNNLKSLSSQLICPSHYFPSTNQQSPTAPLTPTPIPIPKQHPAQQPITFQYLLDDQICYVGIKATLADGRQYIYSPIQIITVWGHIQRNKRIHTMILTVFAFYVVFCICCLLRERRRGYGKIRQDEDAREEKTRVQLAEREIGSEGMLPEATSSTSIPDI